MPEELEAALEFRFRDGDLLRLALVHSSYANEHPDLAPESNERLEFLGDAVLDMVIAAEVYRQFPRMPEGELTSAKSALVRGDALAKVAQQLRLGERLLLGQGEENSGGRGRISSLAGAFEALVGAAFLDQGYEAARGLVLGLFEPALEGLALGGIPKDAKSRLQELVQRQGSPSPVYQIVSEAGPDHAKHFVAEVHLEGQALGRGSGRRKGEAEASAAQDALARLDEKDGDEGNPPDSGWRDEAAT